MTIPAPEYDQRRLRMLASAVMDRTATHKQQQELTSLLKEHTAARDEYLAFVDLHAVLATELAAPTEYDREFQQRNEGEPDSVHQDTVIPKRPTPA